MLVKYRSLSIRETAGLNTDVINKDLVVHFRNELYFVKIKEKKPPFGTSQIKRMSYCNYEICVSAKIST